ncbi:hypothetical protein LTR97_006664 [Elasticomyces elasticus]|uniref:J domain-containing protein n=1 Tax=Elasticomyces elasticus TaxID=574655 RepID=A0AAN7W542_9PEZI|nr:hypothetical protein LTR97_006664 [Elasticomyces elasticus]
MADNDLKQQALSSTTDFYDLLDVPPSASDSEIRRAYRKTALIYHPDKAGANNIPAREKFELLQIAYDVLSDPAVRELYDNARRAKEEKKEREAQFEGRRKWMKEDLERRESGAKRKWDDVAAGRDGAEEDYERELRRLAEDGRRRRVEREQEMRREALKVEEENKEVVQPVSEEGVKAGPTDLDRSVTLRYPTSAATQLDKDAIVKLWERFGPIEDCVLREKKYRKEGEKHRQSYMVAVLLYKSIVGAHAAVSDVEKLQQLEPETWSVFEGIGWAAGREPESISKSASTAQPVRSPQISRLDETPTAPSTPQRAIVNRLKKAPSFASFKATPGGTPGAANSPSLDELTMMRLKNAERRRMEEKIRKEEAAAAVEV